MSKKCIDYLENSFLYLNTATANNYADYSDSDIATELEKYRNYIDSNLKEIIGEIDKSKKHTNIVIDSFSTLPNAETYKQMALYMNQVVIPDPIYELSSRPDKESEAFSSFIGVPEPEMVNRKRLVSSIEYLKEIVALIKAEFAILLPITAIHKREDGVPIVRSKSLFSELLPKKILEIYKESAHVYNVKMHGSQMIIDVNSPLSSGTAICVNFDDTFERTGECFQYTTVRIVESDDTGNCRLRFTIPNSIDEETFNVWVEQSINQAAARHFRAREAELGLAKEMNCMYLTESNLTDRIMKCVIENNVDGQKASAAMALELPVLERLTAEDIIEIRNNYGDAFENFRNDLNLKLARLDETRGDKDFCQ